MRTTLSEVALSEDPLYVILYILNILENKLHNFTVFDKNFTMEFSDLSLSVSIR